MKSLSQGETQTLAYAFISALKDASQAKFPMIVDTPLGIIDEGAPRQLFAELLPEYLRETQIIFLMTSAEYTSKVKQVLSKRVARHYRLDHNKNEGSTVVKLVS